MRGEKKRNSAPTPFCTLFSSLRLSLESTSHGWIKEVEKTVSIESKPPNCRASFFSFVSQDIQRFAPPLFSFVFLSTSPSNNPQADQTTANHHTTAHSKHTMAVRQRNSLAGDTSGQKEYVALTSTQRKEGNVINKRNQHALLFVFPTTHHNGIIELS